VPNLGRRVLCGEGDAHFISLNVVVDLIFADFPVLADVTTVSETALFRAAWPFSSLHVLTQRRR
jgi:hypothetical protein